MEQFIQAVPCFGVVLAIWFVGYFVLSPQDFLRFFKK